MNTDERFHPLVEGTSAAIFVFDSQQNLFINPAARSLTGRSARDLLARSFLSLIHPRFRRSAPTGLTMTAREQVQIVRRDGRPRWVELTLQPILYGGAAATLATVVDIHDLKVSDLARRDAEVQLKLVQRAGRTVSWDWRVADDELTVYGLPKNLLTQGAPTLKTTGKALFEHVSPNDLVHLKQAIRATLQDAEPIFLEIEVRDPKGSSVWLVLRGQAVAESTGLIRHLVGVATDVTDRRRVEETLAREQEHTLAMLASVSDGVIRTDLEGRIVDLSEAAAQLTGLASEEVAGRLLPEVLTLLDPECEAPLGDPVQFCLDSRSPAAAPRDCLITRVGGETIPVRIHTALMSDHSGQPLGALLVLKDLVEHRRSERNMVYLATHDPLTDLLNRAEFERKLGLFLSNATPARPESSLLYLDLDGFKLINDTLGHPAGDKMLKQFASFLKCRFRETDTIGRIGGDKFGVLLENCSPWQARGLTDKLYRDLRTFRFEWEQTTLPVALSTGLTGIGHDETDVDQVLKAAEAACYLAKQRGGDCYSEYEAESFAASERQTRFETLQQIQDALREDLFELHAQLIVPLSHAESSPEMFEILLRMRNREGDMILPGQFIPVAERHRIASAIDRWVLSRCFETLAEESRRRDTRYTINLSGQSLGDDRFLEFILHELSFRGVEPNRFLFEITETATVTSLDKAQRFVSVLKGRGCGFVLDDFGTGLSSFAYLRSFPVDFIKIDGQFVRGMSRDSTQKALVESINHVGHVMNIRTIAEAVESEQTLQVVREMKVDYAQGNKIAQPVPLSSLLIPTRQSLAGT